MYDYSPSCNLKILWCEGCAPQVGWLCLQVGWLCLYRITRPGEERVDVLHDVIIGCVDAQTALCPAVEALWLGLDQ